MQAVSEAPYLSIVTTARNDDHGGRLLHRMQLFVDSLIAQCNRHGLDAELVLVEWNPPEDRPRLAEALRWPDDTGRCTVRIIEVPHVVHARLRHSERLPLFQMIAKNVGIRRARGAYVLATNIDLVFSNELVEFIAKRQLKGGVLYRVDRYDVESDIDESASMDEKLRECERKLIRVCRRDGTLDLRTGEFYRIYDSLYYLPWWIGIPIRIVRDGWRPLVKGIVHLPSRLVRGAVKLWRRASLTVRRRQERVVRRGDGYLGRLLERLQRLHLSYLGVVVVAVIVSPRLVRSISLGLRSEIVSRGKRFRRRSRTLRRLFEFERARVKLHTNASGDFELLARPDWSRTHGYAEFEMYSMHLDSLHMYMAYWSGVRESFLPFRLYHLEHEGGFKPDPVGAATLNDRLARDDVRQISNEQLFDWILEMARTQKPLNFTNDDWGFAATEFPETSIAPVAIAPEPAVRS
jgi:hypothetical protein